MNTAQQSAAWARDLPSLGRRLCCAFLTICAMVLTLAVVGPATPAFAAPLMSVGFSPSSLSGGATGLTYTYSFTTATAQNLTSFTMTVPMGTALVGGTATATGNAGYSITFPTGAPSLADTTLTVSLTTTTWVPASTVVTVAVTGITNTSTPGDYASTITTLQGTNTVDTGTSSTVAITGAALTTPAWWPSTAVTEAIGTTYNVSFTATTAATLTSVTIGGPAGIGGTPTVVAVTGLPSGGSVTRSGSALTYTFAASSIAAGTIVSLAIGNITNPSLAGTYTAAITTRSASGPVDGGITSGVTFAASSLTSPVWAPSSITIGDTDASYSYSFHTVTGGAINSVTFSVPPGTTAPSLSVASLNIDPGYPFSVSGATASLSGTTITLSFTPPSYVNPSRVEVTFDGLTNTPTAGTYASAIATFVSGSPHAVAVSPSVTFAPASAALGSVIWAASATAVGTPGVSYTVTAQVAAETTLDRIAMSVPSGTAGTPGVGVSTPSSITGGTPALSGSTLSYSFAATTLAAGTTFSVTFTGMTNTTTLQTISSSVTAVQGASIVGSGTSNSLTFTSSGLVAPTWVSNNSAVSASDVSYTYTLGLSHAATLTQIRLGVPAGTEGTPTLQQLTNAGPSATPFSGGNVTRSGTTLIVTFDSIYVHSGWTITLVVGSLTNTATPGTYASHVVTRSANSSVASGTTGTQSFAATTLTAVSWSASATITGAPDTSYSYSWGISETTIIDTVTMTVPSGTMGTPTVVAATPTAVSGGTITLVGTTLTYVLAAPHTVSNSSTLHLTIGGLTNTATVGVYSAGVNVTEAGSIRASGNSSAVSFTAASLSSVSWTSSSSSTSAPALYTFGLTTPAGTTTAISVTVPAGTTGTPTIASVEAYNNYGPVSFAGASITRLGTTVTFSFTSQYVQPGTVVSLAVAGLTTTPTTGSYASTITLFNNTNPLASATTAPLSFSSTSLATASWSTSSTAVGASAVAYTYNIAMTTAAEISSLTMTLPAGTAGTAALGTVTPAAFSGGTLTRTGNTLTYSFASTTLASAQLLSIAATGLTNTATTGTYTSTLTASTHDGAIVASGTSSSITFASSLLTAVTWTPSSTLTGAPGLSYQWQFTTAATNQLNRVTLTIPSGTSGTAVLTSATTSPAVVLAAPALTRSGSTLTLDFTGVAVPGGTTFTIVVTGLTNPSVADDYSSSVTTRSSAAPRETGLSAPVSIVPAPSTALEWTMSSTVAATPDIVQTFSFASSTTALIDRIVFSIPAGTTGSPSVVSVSPAPLASNAAVTISGATLTLTFTPTTVAAGTVIAVEIGALTQTLATGSYFATATTMSGSVAIDVAESEPQEITARELTTTISCGAVAACATTPTDATQVTILLIPGLVTPVTADIELSVRTNAPYGYVVSVDSGGLTSASSVIAQAPTSGENTIVADRFGASAALNAGGTSAATLCGAYASSAAQIGYSTSATPLWASDTPTGTTTDTVTLSNNLRVSRVQPAGTYTGSIGYSVEPRYTLGTGC